MGQTTEEPMVPVCDCSRRQEVCAGRPSRRLRAQARWLHASRNPPLLFRDGCRRAHAVPAHVEKDGRRGSADSPASPR